MLVGLGLFCWLLADWFGWLDGWLVEEGLLPEWGMG